MHARAEELVATLGLIPHPEGGYYREVYRSDANVQPLDARTARSALTTIYFLLPAGEVSRWHRVSSDEVWHFYEGAPLELLTADRAFATLTRHRLGPVDEGVQQPVYVVKADDWQAARSTGDYTLVGCTVGPGFEFADFELLRDLSDVAAAVIRRDDGTAQFV
jgi:predicted cupin superfamily sugar epimerase